MTMKKTTPTLDTIKRISLKKETTRKNPYVWDAYFYRKKKTFLMGNLWVECEQCHGWVHPECVGLDINIDENDKLVCFECGNQCFTTKDIGCIVNV